LGAQTTIQEIAAYYSSVADAVARSTGGGPDPLASIPKEYRVVLEPLMEWLPLKDVEKKVVFARAILVEALARAAFNGNCLSEFKSPRAMTVKRLRAYLEEESPHARFQSLVNRMTEEGGLGKLESEIREAIASETSNEAANEALKKAMDAIQLSARPWMYVANPLQNQAARLAFEQGWKSDVEKLAVKLPSAWPSLRPPSVMAAPSEPDSSQRPRITKRLDPLVLEMLFDLSKEGQPGLFLWLYQASAKEFVVEAFFCGVDKKGDLNLSDAAARFRRRMDYMYGIMPVEQFSSTLERAPKGSLIVTFYQQSWRHWLEIGGNVEHRAFAVSGCADVNLGVETIARMSGFPGLREEMVWYGVRFGEQAGGAYFVSNKNPSVFAFQRLTDERSRALFFEMIKPMNLGKAPPTALGTKRLLEVAALLGPDADPFGV
jgi:hypothetical protein